MSEAFPQSQSDLVSYGPLTDSLGFLLRLSQLKSFSAFYDDLGTCGITPGQITVMLMIAENPGIRQGVLARALTIKRAHMTKLIRRMEDAGHVVRRVPADDKRSVELTLSQGGKDFVASLRAPFAAHEAANHSPLTNAEHADLIRLLHKFLDFGPRQKDTP